jgi:hypothetical protein
LVRSKRHADTLSNGNAAVLLLYFQLVTRDYLHGVCQSGQRVWARELGSK